MVSDSSAETLFFLLVVALVGISDSGGLSSGSGELPLQPVGGDGNDSCTVPAYSQPLFEVNATEENTRRLLIEGRCYLSCFNRYLTSVMNETLYPAWPFPILNEDVTCTSNIAQIHECTRGCRILLLDQNVTRQNFSVGTRNTIIAKCLDRCLNECKTECGGREYCNNPDTIDLWVARTGCPNSCNRRIACQLGCLNGEDIVIEDTPYTPSLPLDPVAPPTLTELMDSTISTEQGLYLVNLTKAAGDRDGGGGQYFWNGFLFRILDLVSSNITYVWQRDPTKYLNLSSHICREVEVSFAVVNRFGPTAFSAPSVFAIRGDARQLPNAPFIRQIQDSLDRRNGFFQNVIINVTWETPQDDSHLIHFEVSLRSDQSVFAPSYCGDTVITFTVQHTSQREYSVLLQAQTSRQDPIIMGCNYKITITSVGQDGNRSVSKLHTAKSFEDYVPEMMMFSCSKKLAISSRLNPYFQFFYTLKILASNLAEGNYFSQFEVSRDIVNVMMDRGQTQEMIIKELSNPGPIQYNPIDNRSLYTFEDLAYSRFHQPRPNPAYYFLFRLNITWNASQLLFPPNLNPFRCKTSALSPRPSDVRNFDILNAEILSVDSVSIEASWLAPLVANGILSNYQLCTSREPLTGLEEPRDDLFCENVNGTKTSINITLRYLKLSEDDFIYIQIRPNNTFEEGNWSNYFPVPLKPDVPTTSEPSDNMADKTNDLFSNTPVINSSRSLTDGEVALIAVFIVILVVAVIGLCILCMVCYVRALRRRKRLVRLTETAPNYMPMFSVSYSAKESPPELEVDSMDNTLTDDWELLPSDVTVDKRLGEGAFGEVYRGYLKGPLANVKVKPEFRNALHLPVAIKLLKDTAKGSERQDFLSEMEMMKKVSEGNNPHVVAMLGCVTTQEPLCLVTEFVEYGDLLSYLRSSRNLYFTGGTIRQEDPYLQLGQLSPADLPSFSYQIAAGMAYLSSIGIVHRDLACRNVLVSSDKALRITDFGMSRETEDIYIQQSKGRVPYKWMAIESIIAREFTSASDVWAFGVVLWEIETLGGVPYPGVSNAELLPLLKRGHRMEKPDSCSPEIYNIMLSCWQEDSTQRPTFHALKSKFNDIIASHGTNSYVDFCIDPNKLYYKTDEESDIPPSIHLLHPSPRVDRKSKNVSPSGSFEVVSLKRSSSSPQHNSKMKGEANIPFALSPSTERLLTGHAAATNHREDRRPSSMMLLKPSFYEEERRRKSGMDQDLSKEGDDRYVKDPSALLGIPSFAFGGSLEGNHDGHDRKTGGSDSKLNLNSKATPMVE